MSQTCSQLGEISFLEETARSTSADYSRQQARLDVLSASFEKQRLTASPTGYAAMRAEVEQQELITAAALRARDSAEAQRAAAQEALQAEEAEKLKTQRRQALQAELSARSTKIDELTGLYRTIPDQIAAERWQHSRLLTELAALG
jgi:hypothetical protein